MERIEITTSGVTSDRNCSMCAHKKYTKDDTLCCNPTGDNLRFPTSAFWCVCELLKPHEIKSIAQGVKNV